jgi:sugar lactone lactonase YvrE
MTCSHSACTKQARRQPITAVGPLAKSRDWGSGYRSGQLALLVAVTTLIATGLLAGGCSSGPQESASPDAFLYATNFGSNSISGYAVDSTTGGLSLLPQFPLSTGPDSRPSRVVATPSGDFLYVSTSVGYRGYRVNRQSGLLAEIPGSPFLSPGVPFVDPSGKFLLALSGIGASALDGAGAVSVLSIDAATGALTPVGTPLTVGFRPSTLAFTADSALVFVSRVGAIDILRLDTASGVLTESAVSPFLPEEAPGPLNVVANLLVVAAPLVNAIAVYSINSGTGELAPVGGSPFPISTSPLDQMTVHPSGKFLYVVDLPACCLCAACRDTEISALTVTLNGSVVTAPGSPFPIGTASSGVIFSYVPSGVTLSVHPSGNFLYATNLGDSIFGYRIDTTTGSLAPIDGSPFPAGSQTVSLAIVPRAVSP